MMARGRWARAGGRLHGGAEAGRADAADGAAARRAGARGRASRRRHQRRHRRRRRRARRSSTTPASTRSRSPARPRSAARSGARRGGALKRVTLELGGKSPNIILPDADLEEGDRAARSRASTSTPARLQRGLAAVRAGGSSTSRLGARRARAKMKMGPGSTPRRSSGRWCRGAARPRHRLHREGQGEGAELVLGGKAATAARLLHRADAVRRRDGRHRDRARGDLRPGAGRVCGSRDPSMRWPRATTARVRPRPPASGPATSAAPTASQQLLQGRHGVGERTGGSPTRRRPSAASRHPASAASTAAPGSMSTSSPRRSGPA